MSSVAFGRKSRTGIFHRFAKSGVAVCMIACALAAPALAATKVAVINGGSSFPQTEGEGWCELLDNNGYDCTLFPESGPTAPLDPFAVIVSCSSQWTDPQHLLAQVMQSGRGVIAWGWAPEVLGVNNDPVVQAWVGANQRTFGNQSVKTTATDSLLGDLVPGTEISHTGDFGAVAVDDITGHPGAKVLARHNGGTGTIALLRNRWTGQSVYLSNALFPGAPVHNDIFLRAVGELSVRTIPATSFWGILILGIAVLVIGSILAKARKSWIILQAKSIPGNQSYYAVVGFLLVVSGTIVRAEVVISANDGQNTFQVDSNPPFYSTTRAVQNARSVAIPSSRTWIFLWEELTAQLEPVPMYAIFLEGSEPARITDTSYLLNFQRGSFDPLKDEVNLPVSLRSDAEEQLFIIQFWTQYLTEYDALLRERGFSVLHTLPSNAVLVKGEKTEVQQITAFAFVRSISPLHPGFRIERNLLSDLRSDPNTTTIWRVSAQLVDRKPETIAAAERAIVHNGADLIYTSSPTGRASAH